METLLFCWKGTGCKYPVYYQVGFRDPDGLARPLAGSLRKQTARLFLKQPPNIKESYHQHKTDE